MITIHNLEEMEKYYDEQINTYVFDDNVEFTINIDVESNIDAYNIKAQNIDAWDIDACNIKAKNINTLGINAQDINYFAYCIAYYTFKCKSAKSSRYNSICKCLDKEIEYVKEDK